MFGKSSLKFLNDVGYYPITHPEEGIDPLITLVKENGKSLKLWGYLNKLTIEGKVPVPSVRKDLQAAIISGNKTSKLSVGAGIKLLQALLSAFGVKGAGIEGEYRKAKTIEFVYENVLIDRVLPADIWAYLKDAKSAIDDDDYIKERFDDRGEAFVITDTVKSNSFGAIARDENGQLIKVDIDAIKEVVGVNAKLDRAAGGEIKLCFEGSAHLRFGFKAEGIQLIFDPEPRFIMNRSRPKGRAWAMKVPSGSMDRSEPTEPSPVPELPSLDKGILFDIVR